MRIPLLVVLVVGCVSPDEGKPTDVDTADGGDDEACVGSGTPEVCDGIDNDCNDAVDDGATSLGTWYADSDGDGAGDSAVTTLSCDQPSGFVSNSNDCDDTSAAIGPTATESCNGTDDNCDGSVDEETALDASTWYADADGDDFGASESTLAACDQPSGYVADGTDCDDTDADVSPDATELCNGADDNCDGVTDESSAADASSWYTDSDGDDYGSGAASLACSAPAGTVANDDDCDDTDASISPAGSEICDGEDNDCDGSADEGIATSTWYADADDDDYGDPDVTTAACSAPTGYVGNDDDCDDDDASAYPGAAELDDVADNDCDGQFDEDFIAVGDVIFSEVARNPLVGGTTSNPDAYWVEVYNTTSTDIVLSNWSFGTSNGTSGVQSVLLDPLAEVTVPATGYAVLCATDTFAAQAGATVPLACDYEWRDSGEVSTYVGTYTNNVMVLGTVSDTLKLSLNGVTIDQVAYTSSWTRAQGRAMALDVAQRTSVANDSSTSWCLVSNSGSTWRWYDATSGTDDFGSPGVSYDCP